MNKDKLIEYLKDELKDLVKFIKNRAVTNGVSHGDIPYLFEASEYDIILKKYNYDLEDKENHNMDLGMYLAYKNVLKKIQNTLIH